MSPRARGAAVHVRRLGTQALTNVFAWIFLKALDDLPGTLVGNTPNPDNGS